MGYNIWKERIFATKKGYEDIMDVSNKLTATGGREGRHVAVDR